MSADPVSFSFGDSPQMADELLGLVLAGKKTATCGALRDFDGTRSSEPMPVVGRQDVVLDGQGRPAALIETLDVAFCRFDEIDADFAEAEGEGPFETWHSGHQTYFTRNGGFDPKMKLVCERFKLVRDLRADQTRPEK